MAFLIRMLFLDPSAPGRVDASLMSDETLMELLVSKMPTRDRFQNKEGEFLPIKQWSCVTLDDEATVIGIEINPMPGKGSWRRPKPSSIDLRWLPPKVKHVRICRCFAQGTVETSALPQNIETLQISGNRLDGTFSIEGLPEQMQTVSIARNEFHGSLNLRALPPVLESFYANRNQFSGTLDLCNLPQSLVKLLLNENLFTGELRICSIPQELKSLNVRQNKFNDGVAVIDCIPEGVQSFRIDAKFRGKVVNLKGEKHPSEKISF